MSSSMLNNRKSYKPGSSIDPKLMQVLRCSNKLSAISPNSRMMLGVVVLLSVLLDLKLGKIMHRMILKTL
jgi:hypothetical protein